MNKTILKLLDNIQSNNQNISISLKINATIITCTSSTAQLKALLQLEGRNCLLELFNKMLIDGLEKEITQ